MDEVGVGRGGGGVYKLQARREKGDSDAQSATVMQFYEMQVRRDTNSLQTEKNGAYCAAVSVSLYFRGLPRVK